jgi:hypothetical protein
MKKSFWNFAKLPICLSAGRGDLSAEDLIPLSRSWCFSFVRRRDQEEHLRDRNVKGVRSADVLVLMVPKENHYFMTSSAISPKARTAAEGFNLE